MFPAVEAGACPHTVIREDPTLNIAAGDELERRFPGVELIIFESGGDNLASTFSLDLVDWWIFVIDVAGGDDIPRKRGPGVLRCDLLVVNKTDLAPFVGVDLDAMLAEAQAVRDGRPILATNARTGEGVAGGRRRNQRGRSVSLIQRPLPCSTSSHANPQRGNDGAAAVLRFCRIRGGIIAFCPRRRANRAGAPAVSLPFPRYAHLLSRPRAAGDRDALSAIGIRQALSR